MKFSISECGLKEVPKGTKFLVREPEYKMANDGVCLLKITNLKDIDFLDKDFL